MAVDTTFDLDFNFTNAKNIFAVYLGGLFLLAYCLSIFVSILHLRTESVVYSLTRPQPDVYFAEYIILIRTSQIIGVLGNINQVEIYLVNDAPNEIPFVDWDAHCLFTALCSFHVWLSLFNCPMRFGTYTNVVNVIVIYFIVSGLMWAALLTSIAPVQPGSRGIFVLLGDNTFNGIALPTFFIWLLELFVEAIFRNTVPKVSACSYSMFQGLVKPVASLYGLRDFVVNYNWEKVSLLIPQKRVIIPYGSRHPNALSIFPVEPVHSYYNLWGQLNLDVGRWGNLYIRSLTVCALPLPVSMRWLSKEARSRKEDLLVKQFMNKFESPMCYFCAWLVDWPLHYIDEPSQAGLIMSHIICTDILFLSNLKNKENCARLAQICVHQWHGMIAFVFLHVCRQSIEYRGESASSIRNFINRTMTKFGKRNAREIQATWRKRQNRLTEMNLQKTKGVPAPLEQIEDENRSAISVHSNGPVIVDKSIWKTICLYNDKKESSSLHGIDNEFANFDTDLYDDFTEDYLVFDDTYSTGRDSKSPQALVKKGNEVCNESDVIITVQTTSQRKMPAFSIVQEGDVSSQSKRKSLREFGANRRRPLIHTVSVDAIEDGNIKLDNADGNISSEIYCKTDAASTFNPSGAEICGDSRNEADMNMNAAVSQKEAQKKGPSPVVSRPGGQKQEIVKQIVQQKQLVKQEASKERTSLPVAPYEEVSLGPPFDISLAKEKDQKHDFNYLRHANEIVAHACKISRCQANVDIHKVVGVSSLEILKKLLKDILDFALGSNNIVHTQKLWQRKKMVKVIYELMQQKASNYDPKRFKNIKVSEIDGTVCNQLLTAILSILETIIDVTVTVRNEGRSDYEQRREQQYEPLKSTTDRCIFCAKPLGANITSNNKGCYSLVKLTKFFSKSTIIVAEKELNIEFSYKYSVQRYCAMTVSYAMREVLLELEDPPLVLACKVTRAMICSLLEGMLPKITSFKDMTADELRRVGTRRERIQARHDPTMGGNRKESEEEKRRKQMLTNLHEQLSSKWRIGVKENELDYCAGLLAQILVEERIMGFSVYTGFLLKEHEELLNGNRTRLVEMERMAHVVVLKIARRTMRPLLKTALQSSKSVDVLFSNQEQETMYLLEAVCVAQLSSEPTFLKTCCYYIENIIMDKVDEFKKFSLYMKSFVPSRDLKQKLKLKMFRTPQEGNNKIKLQIAEQHSLVASPALRWGPAAVKGISPVPVELKMEKSTEAEFKEKLPSIISACSGDDKKQQIVSKLLKTRLKVKGFLDMQKAKKNKKLCVHLAQVQARLTEQIALLSQSITNTFSLDTEYQQEYSNDDLFNVEFYATRNLKLPFPTNMGTMLIIILIILTVGMTMFTTLKAGNMDIPQVQKWFLKCLYSVLVYGFIFEPLKCVGYRVLQLYNG